MCVYESCRARVRDNWRFLPKKNTGLLIIYRIGYGEIYMVIWRKIPMSIVQTGNFCVETWCC